MTPSGGNYAGIRRKGFLEVTFILIFTTSGCYDLRELDSIFIVTGVALDKAEQPGLIELSVQIAKSDVVASGKSGNKQGGGGEQKATILLDSVKPNTNLIYK
ncbi:MAG: hypothetical protein PHH84_02345, partial [Oscillospiraceae bacterium]|nr:hypothetical protein [Oscillospiraceae bacterium]